MRCEFSDDLTKVWRLKKIPPRRSILTPFDEDGGAAAAVPSLLEQMPIAACCLGAESIPPAESGSKECPSHDGPRIFGLRVFAGYVAGASDFW